jgi:hypothetical protein
LNDQLPLDLQSRYEKPEHVGAPYAIGSDTSKAAAKKVAKRVALQQTEVYRAIIRAGEHGATWDELVAQYGFSPTANGRVTRLVEMGPRRRQRTATADAHRLQGHGVDRGSSTKWRGNAMTALDLQVILNRITVDTQMFVDHVFEVDDIECVSGHLFRSTYLRPDSDTKRLARGHGRWWFVPNDASEQYIVMTALKAVLTNAEHEIRECFTYRGKRIFGPHPDIAGLMEIAR